MDEDFSNSISPQETNDGSQTRKRKKRVRNWTASDRARHRVFEKGRREAFNERLMELARLLPDLQHAKDSQLSKHVIINESVKHHKAQQASIESLKKSLDRALSQQQQLLAEISAWRQSMDFQPAENQELTEVPSRVLPETQYSAPSNHVPLPQTVDGPVFDEGNGRFQPENGIYPMPAETANVDSFQHRDDPHQNINPQVSSMAGAHMSMYPKDSPYPTQGLQQGLEFAQANSTDFSGAYNGVPFIWPTTQNEWFQSPQNNPYQHYNIAPG